MKTIYKRTDLITGEEEYFTFAEVKSKTGFRGTRAAFDNCLDTYQCGEACWETSYEPLPVTGLNCGETVTVDNTPWWTDWTANTNPTPVAAKQAPDTREELRNEIYVRNLGIRVGIARDTFLHQDELFDHPFTEVDAGKPIGIRFDDGTNVMDCGLWEFIHTTHLTLNWHNIDHMLRGHLLGYNIELSDAARDALEEYRTLFRETANIPSMEYVAGKTIPIEQYNRFGEIECVYPNARTAAKVNNLTMQQLVLKLHSWDDNSRIQFRYARQADIPQTDKIFFPLEQWMDGTLVNKFTTLQEASAALGYSKSVIGRWSLSGEVDNFGCTWKRIRRD